MLDHNYIINKFPKIELFYDKILHRKIQSDVYVLIPHGIRVFAWFTYFNSTNLCVILHLDKFNNIVKLEEVVLSYDKKLSYGTIIRGTYFIHNGARHISCEDIYFYKGQNVHNQSYRKRLEIFKIIFDTELRQVLYDNNFAVLGLPVICDNLDTALQTSATLPYKVKGIIFQNYEDNRNLGLMLNNVERKVECVFKVKANIVQDIYNLYCKSTNNSRDEFYNIPLISDYKTSVMMNTHFRKIKENQNLDALEESDDEEEFENIREDKFVDLEKVVYMRCEYVKRFRKWKPIDAVNFGEKLLCKREIYQLEK